MSVLRAATALFIGHLKTFLRSRTALYWSLAFPLFFLFIFGFVFGHSSPEGIGFLLPGLLTITVISGSFYGVAMRVVSEREAGILRRHRVTPVSPVAVVLAYAAMGLVTLVLSLLLQIVVARLVFHAHIAAAPGSLAVVLVSGALALIPLGLIVGSVARDMRTAPAISNLVFFPLMFLSGAAIPFMMLPEWMQSAARFVPTTWLVESLQGLLVRGEGLASLAGPVTVLLLTSVAGIALNSLLFRWEGTEPVRPRRLLAAFAVLGALYLGVHLLAPALEMATYQP